MPILEWNSSYQKSGPSVQHMPHILIIIPDIPGLRWGNAASPRVWSESAASSWAFNLITALTQSSCLIYSDFESGEQTLFASWLNVISTWANSSQIKEERLLSCLADMNYWACKQHRPNSAVQPEKPNTSNRQTYIYATGANPDLSEPQEILGLNHQVSCYLFNVLRQPKGQNSKSYSHQCFMRTRLGGWSKNVI